MTQTQNDIRANLGALPMLKSSRVITCVIQYEMLLNILELLDALNSLKRLVLAFLASTFELPCYCMLMK